MRYIRKGGLSPQLQKKLSDALAQNRNWKNIRREKLELRDVLEKEQLGLCAYSEISLTDYGFHLEHISPKEDYPLLKFCYKNIVASSPKCSNAVPNHDLFGGHKKDDNYDPQSFISPTDVQCGDFFRYSPEGDIYPAFPENDSRYEKAKYTIDCLGLQCGLLIRERKKIYEDINEQLKYLFEHTNYNSKVISKFKASLTNPGTDGNLHPFQSMIMQMIF